MSVAAGRGAVSIKKTSARREYTALFIKSY
jgi:hypothetical protein